MVTTTALVGATGVMESIVALSGIGILVLTGGLVVVAVRSVRDQLRVQIFADYTRRYNEIVIKLPSRWRRPGEVLVFEQLSLDDQEEMLAAARGYLNLCSEELHLHRHGHIDKSTWDVWTRGMQDSFKLPWLANMWERLRPEYEYYPVFCNFVDEIERSDLELSTETRTTTPAEKPLAPDA